jgi:hypothetical protein
MKSLRLFAALFALLIFRPALASADTTLGTAIATIPVTLSKSGVYHFTKNLSYSGSGGAAITVTVPDVVIDLNGFTLTNLYGAATATSGVYCLGVNRVTVKDGTILGFRNGVNLTGNNESATGLLVVSSFRTGISVTGSNASITCNRVNVTGGASDSGILLAAGISLTGTYGVIGQNQVERTYTTDTAKHFAAGIELNGCSNVVINNNQVLDVEPAAPANATSEGIAAGATSSSDNVIILNNIVTTAEIGFDLSGGSSGSYGDNTTSGVATGYYNTGSGMANINNNN